MSLGRSASRGGEEALSRSGPGGEDAFQESVAEGHTPVASLRAFRARLHAFFSKRADALLELTDEILTAGGAERFRPSTRYALVPLETYRPPARGGIGQRAKWG